jgi:hypothetical protein
VYIFDFYDCPLVATSLSTTTTAVLMGDCAILEIDEGKKKDPLRTYRQMSNEKEKKEKKKENK